MNISRDASDSESEGADDNVGEDEDGDFGGVGCLEAPDPPPLDPAPVPVAVDVVGV